MTDTTTDTRLAFHFGYTDEAAQTDRTVVDVILTVFETFRDFGISPDHLLAAYDEGDSFREWCESKHDDDYATETWGSKDSYHGMVFLSGDTPHGLARMIFESLVQAGIADPTADCSPSHWEAPCAWALTSAEDFSVQFVTE